MITKGKWEAFGDGYDYHVGIKDGEVIAQHMSEANANLMVRAPQLEEENKELRDVLKEVCTSLMRGVRDSWTIRQIREVLPKGD